MKTGKDWTLRENEHEGASNRGDNMNIGMESGILGKHQRSVWLKKGEAMRDVAGKAISNKTRKSIS